MRDRGSSGTDFIIRNKTELSKRIFFDFDINVGLKLKRCERFLFLQLVDLRSPPTVGVKRQGKKSQSERSNLDRLLKLDSHGENMTVLILKRQWISIKLDGSKFLDQNFERN